MDYSRALDICWLCAYFWTRGIQAHPAVREDGFFPHFFVDFRIATSHSRRQPMWLICLVNVAGRFCEKACRLLGVGRLCIEY